MRENGGLLVDKSSPETSPETFLKARQMAVSEVQGRQYFYTAAFYTIVASGKHELQVRPSSKLAEDRSSDKNSLKTKDDQFQTTVSYLSGQVLVLSSQIPDKSIHQYVTVFIAKQLCKCDSCFSEITGFCIPL